MYNNGSFIKETGSKVESIAPGDTFIMVYEDVWQEFKGDSALYVYMGLKRHTWAQNATWYGSRADLAKESGISVDTFDRAVKKLVNVGLISVTSRFVRKDWDGQDNDIVPVRDEDHPVQIGNLYKIGNHIGDFSNAPQPQKNPDPQSQKNPGPQPRNTDTEVYPFKARSLNYTNVSQTTDDTSLFQVENEPAPDPIEEQFKEFWEEYPRHDVSKSVCKSKLKTALKKVTFEEMMIAVRNYRDLIESEQREKKFIKLPTTWLNQNLWEVHAIPASKPSFGNKTDGKIGSIHSMADRFRQK